MDSRFWACFVKPFWDSRICDEKAGLCSGEQGDKTWVSIDEASHKLPALSPKAESLLEKVDSRALTALPLQTP